MSAPCIGMSWRESRALLHTHTHDTCGTQIRNRNLEIHFFIVARRDKEEEDSAAPVPDISCGQISDGIPSSFLRSFFFIFFFQAHAPVRSTFQIHRKRGKKEHDLIVDERFNNVRSHLFCFSFRMISSFALSFCLNCPLAKSIPTERRKEKVEGGNEGGVSFPPATAADRATDERTRRQEGKGGGGGGTCTYVEVAQPRCTTSGKASKQSKQGRGGGGGKAERGRRGYGIYQPAQPHR